MYTLYSPLKPDAWKQALKQNFRSPLYVFDERVTGIVIGPFFSVAHYQEYEWNRRITSQCSRAWGFVKEVDGQSEITFLRGWGLLAPGWVLYYTALCELVSLLAGRGDPIFMSPGWLIGCFLMSLFVCAMTVLGDSMTEGGRQSWWALHKCLEDPENYY